MYDTFYPVLSARYTCFTRFCQRASCVSLWKGCGISHGLDFCCFKRYVSFRNVNVWPCRAPAWLHPELLRNPPRQVTFLKTILNNKKKSKTPPHAHDFGLEQAWFLRCRCRAEELRCKAIPTRHMVQRELYTARRCRRFRRIAGWRRSVLAGATQSIFTQGVLHQLDCFAIAGQHAEVPLYAGFILYIEPGHYSWTYRYIRARR